MAYGFICANCGYVEAEHRDGNAVGLSRRLGYHSIPTECQGFTYRLSDEKSVIAEVLADDVRPEVPVSLRREVIPEEEEHDSLPIRHEVFQVWQTPKGLVVIDVGG
jgi:hypothetical protein